MHQDTIAAIATPPGNGGVGIVRVSGKSALLIAEQITSKKLIPRYATWTTFKNEQDDIIDEGIVIYFKSPHSFTGEDVIEFQGHGGQVIMDCLLQCVLRQGARMALPGEFSERAFLNDKLDLVQAEAIADMINATTVAAAQSAARSLQGVFSKEINQLLEKLIQLRMWVESAIDFIDQDIDFVGEYKIIDEIKKILSQLECIRAVAEQGVLLQAGIHVVIVGLPNAGKSSLLNCLSGRNSAIVTDIAGTTRDILREQIHLDGLPLHLIDTAGIRETDDVIEKEGVHRARLEIEKADLILWVYEATEKEAPVLDLPKHIPVIKIRNKIDLISEDQEATPSDVVNISLKENKHIDVLKSAIKSAVNFQTGESSTFIARRRHLEAIDNTTKVMTRGLTTYQERQSHELLAEDLREASQYLGAITGAFTTDDLLGKIFSEFCIGK